MNKKLKKKQLVELTRTEKEYLRSFKGPRGRNLLIEPERADGILQSEEGNLIQRGKVVQSGPDAYCKVGDTVIFNEGFAFKKEMNGKTYWFILDTDECILHVS